MNEIDFKAFKGKSGIEGRCIVDEFYQQSVAEFSRFQAERKEQFLRELGATLENAHEFGLVKRSDSNVETIVRNGKALGHITTELTMIENRLTITVTTGALDS